MTMYIGIVDGSGSTWGCRIPDFPGCNGGGASPKAAVEDATSALAEVAADMLASGEALPVPRDLDDIRAEIKRTKAIDGGAVYIPLLIEGMRSVRANISIEADLLSTIDDEARRRGLTRSAFMAAAAREKISRSSTAGEFRAAPKAPPVTRHTPRRA